MNRMCQNCPRIEVPAPLQASETGTWTHTSVVKRLPDVGQRILKENDFDEETSTNLRQLIDGIPHEKIRLLEDDHAPDVLEWNRIIQPYEGKNWLDVPWLFVEFYFYRRVIEATGYFEKSRNYMLDPYQYQKEQGLSISVQAIVDLCDTVDDWKIKKVPLAQQLEKLLKISLWGNQLDLSIWPADGEPANQNQNSLDNQSHIVVDHAAVAVERLLSDNNENKRVDIILDNAGFELICDLMLADRLIEEKVAETVCFHLKSMPTYVSDTMIKDVEKTVEFCLQSSEAQLQAFGKRIKKHISANRLILEDHLFWTSSQKFWLLDHDLKQELQESNLLVFKGDANFRRLLGDAHWPFETDFSDIVCYFSVPVLSLRIYKSEVACCIPHERVRELNDMTEDWMINGQWGMIVWYDGVS